MKEQALQEETMTTKMSPEQVDEFVKKRKEQNDKNWEEIASELKRLGVVNVRKEPYAAATLKFRYYDAVHEAKLSKGGLAEDKLDMIKRMLRLPKADDKTKLTLIQSVLEQD